MTFKGHPAKDLKLILQWSGQDIHAFPKQTEVIHELLSLIWEMNADYYSNMDIFWLSYGKVLETINKSRKANKACPLFSFMFSKQKYERILLEMRWNLWRQTKLFLFINIYFAPLCRHVSWESIYLFWITCRKDE